MDDCFFAADLHPAWVKEEATQILTYQVAANPELVENRLKLRFCGSSAALYTGTPLAAWPWPLENLHICHSYAILAPVLKVFTALILSSTSNPG